MPLPGVEARVIGFVPQTCASICFIPCIFDAAIEIICGIPTDDIVDRGEVAVVVRRDGRRRVDSSLAHVGRRRPQP